MPNNFSDGIGTLKTVGNSWISHIKTKVTLVDHISLSPVQIVGQPEVKFTLFSKNTEIHDRKILLKVNISYGERCSHQKETWDSSPFSDK